MPQNSRATTAGRHARRPPAATPPAEAKPTYGGGIAVVTYSCPCGTRLWETAWWPAVGSASRCPAGGRATITGVTAAPRR